VFPINNILVYFLHHCFGKGNSATSVRENLVWSYKSGAMRASHSHHPFRPSPYNDTINKICEKSLFGGKICEPIISVSQRHTDRESQLGFSMLIKLRIYHTDFYVDFDMLHIQGWAQPWKNTCSYFIYKILCI
jgi:hypothetical protein